MRKARPLTRSRGMREQNARGAMGTRARRPLPKRESEAEALRNAADPDGETYEEWFARRCPDGLPPF